MDQIYNDIESTEELNQEDCIKRISELLAKHCNFEQAIAVDSSNEYEVKLEKILHLSIHYGREKIVRYLLNQGVNMTKLYPHECDVDDDYWGRPWSTFEISIVTYFTNRSNNKHLQIFESMKEKALMICSTYGLHPMHIECASGDWRKMEKFLKEEPGLLNKPIDAQSPIWPGMTPILISSKFDHIRSIKRLLKLGAHPLVRDSKGNTVLH